MPGQVIGEGHADAEHADQAFPEPRFGAQGGADLGHVRSGARARFAVGPDDPGQPAQREIGIRRPRDRLQHRVVLRRPAEAGGGTARFTVADVES